MAYSQTSSVIQISPFPSGTLGFLLLSSINLICNRTQTSVAVSQSWHHRIKLFVYNTKFLTFTLFSCVVLFPVYPCSMIDCHFTKHGGPTIYHPSVRLVILDEGFLKTLETIGICQRSVFSLGVSQHMHKITNLGKFELNWSSEFWDNYERKNTLVKRSCLLLDAMISRPQILNLRSQNQICGKLLLSWKLRHFRGSRFSQCFILSTSPHYSLPSDALCW